MRSAQSSDELLEQKEDSRVRVQLKPWDGPPSPWERTFREMARERGENQGLGTPAPNGGMTGLRKHEEEPSSKWAALI